MAKKRTVTPLEFGVLDAKDPIDCYNALQRCHSDALKYGYGISYKGIDTLRIEIPSDALPLPLTGDVDFGNVTIIVENKQNDCFLFRMTTQMMPISVSGNDIDNGNFRSHSILKSGFYLLVVEDEEPWCSRKGYDSKVKRKDVFFINCGYASIRPIMSYSSICSKPVAKYCPTDTEKKTIKNLRFVRTKSSLFETYCFSIVNQYNVELKEINIITPENDEKFADKAIYLENCVDVTLNDIHINGTYSQRRKFGYGICLMNISDLKVNRMFGRGNWGIFGTHCLNKVSLNDCDINRFDIHCYGRDVRAYRCKFSQLYNQFSSVFGTIEFSKCEFVNFRPVLIESSYNAYTPFNLVWKNCVFHLDKEHNFLMTLFGVPEAYNERPELRRKSLPNITMKNCRVILDDEVTIWYLVQTGGVNYKDSFDGITNITINGLTVENEESREFKLFSEEVKTTNHVETLVKKH